MVTLAGSSLTLDELLAVARQRIPVQLDSVALELARCRAVVERTLASEATVYGLTTGVASLKRVTVQSSAVHRFNRALVREHRIAQGQMAPLDVARAATLILANQFASGVPGVRPLPTERLVSCLNDDTNPTIRLLGFGRDERPRSKRRPGGWTV